MKKQSIIKDALILFAITCISGLLLGGVYQGTVTQREAQQASKKTKAYTAVCPSSASFKEEAYTEKLENADDILSKNEAISDTEIEAALDAYDSNGVKNGYVVTATCSKSYGGDLTLTVGMDLTGKITGIEILTISDTPGLGMNAKKDSFKNQYYGKNADTFTITKTGEKGDGMIDAISSATITSKAFNNAVNACEYFCKTCMMEGGDAK